MSVRYSVVLFYSTSAAIRTESLAQRTGLEVKLIPVPRHLSSDCGVCLRFETDDTDNIAAILEDKNVEYASIQQV